MNFCYFTTVLTNSHLVFGFIFNTFESGTRYYKCKKQALSIIHDNLDKRNHCVIWKFSLKNTLRTDILVNRKRQFTYCIVQISRFKIQSTMNIINELRTASRTIMAIKDDSCTSLIVITCYLYASSLHTIIGITICLNRLKYF